MAGALLLLLWIAWPRLDHSLWADEQTTLLGPVLGSFVRDLPEDVVSEAVPPPIWENPTWLQTVWGYESTNQHFLCSILSRAALNTWQFLFKKDPWEFSETVLRLFPLLATLCGIVLWSLVARRFFGRPTALALAALLAFHPWIVRFSTEMRGYAYVFLLLAVIFLLVGSALAHPQWRFWISFAVAQFLLLYSWPGMAISTVGLNLAVFYLIWRSRRAENGLARVKLKRWLVANILTFSLLAPFIVPTIYQIVPFIEEGSPRRAFDFNWWPNLFAHFVAGMDWTDWGNASATNPHFHSIESLLKTKTTLVVVMLTTFFALLVVGWLTAFRQYRAPTLAITAIAAGSTIVMVFIALASEIYLFPWYFFQFLPVVLLGVALGLGKLSTMAGNRRWRLVPGALWLAGLAFLAWPKLDSLRSQPLGAIRESVLEIRGEIPNPTDYLKSNLIIAHVGGAAYSYDPLGWLVFSDYVTGPDKSHFLGLVQLMSLADRTDSELYVISGLPSDVREKLPAVQKWLDNEEAFTHFKTLHGTEATTVHQLYHYEGGFFDPLR
ncbi:MAG: glycosyltransferase family 39 protein [Verrucomicrobiota bacterium]